LPGRGEEQSEDEGKTGHGVLHRASAQRICAFSEEAASACVRQITRT
jgi:hypothetical protein